MISSCVCLCSRVTDICARPGGRGATLEQSLDPSPGPGPGPALRATRGGRAHFCDLTCPYMAGRRMSASFLASFRSPTPAQVRSTPTDTHVCTCALGHTHTHTKTRSQAHMHTYVDTLKNTRDTHVQRHLRAHRHTYVLNGTRRHALGVAPVPLLPPRELGGRLHQLDPVPQHGDGQLFHYFPDRHRPPQGAT